MNFAEKELKKYGWKGNGFGLREDSRSNPIIPAQKLSLSGIGNTEWDNWWDDKYNLISVNVQIGEQKDRKEQKEREKKLLYGRFVKGESLHGKEPPKKREVDKIKKKKRKKTRD